MGLIYAAPARSTSSAAYTVIWLGPEDQLTAEGVKTLQLLSPNMARLLEGKITAFGGSRRAAYTQCGLPFISAHSWDALASIYLRPWFSRAWIAQEAYLSRHLLMFCGEHEIDWHELGELALGLPDMSSVGLSWSSKSGTPGHPMRAEQSMAALNSLCTEPRDKIFSLFGLRSYPLVPFGGLPAADYALDVATVYTTATRAIIQDERCLAYPPRLYSANANRRVDIPSWALDFQNLSSRPSIAFDAAKGMDIGHSGDNDAELFVWDIAESPVTIMAACIPTLRVFLREKTSSGPSSEITTRLSRFSLSFLSANRNRQMFDSQDIEVIRETHASIGDEEAVSGSGASRDGGSGKGSESVREKSG
ncbi:hypothetical protein B0T16DRAFT_395371 [Cercophora newfieldiana]|uniref:Heterokaryon incompatibility domain-containing protein n=1 Tax=Cercophora newfieldiana TaxID=92897 RepID=A0AA39XT16_9PEZI|nr:hypothetical protein B0T16DRAFT_395371 [Cercophora newfieldiana]